jgi:hypothetical protein
MAFGDKSPSIDDEKYPPAQMLLTTFWSVTIHSLAHLVSSLMSSDYSQSVGIAKEIILSQTLASY